MEEKPVTLNDLMSDETKAKKESYLNYVSYLFNKYDVRDEEYNKYLMMSQNYIEEFGYDCYERGFDAGVKADEEQFEERLQEIADVLEIVNQERLNKIVSGKEENKGLNDFTGFKEWWK